MELEIVRGGSFSANSFLLIDQNKKQILIIDLGLPGKLTMFKLRKKLAKVTQGNYGDYSIEVFLTHCHIDHVKGEDNLKKFSNVIFSASELTDQDGVTLLAKYNLKIPYKVEKIYANGDTIPFADTTLRVISAPGHTDGSTVLYDEKNKSLFAGDVVFAGGGCGRVDFPSGSRKAMIETLGMLAELEIDHLYSGHGEDLHSNVRQNTLLAKRLMESW
ncbi:MAG: MBL fold metallo-hydrolase [Candidatus Heimdallarchaeota archaeon]